MFQNSAVSKQSFWVTSVSELLVLFTHSPYCKYVNGVTAQVFSVNGNQIVEVAQLHTKTQVQ